MPPPSVGKSGAASVSGPEPVTMVVWSFNGRNVQDSASSWLRSELLKRDIIGFGDIYGITRRPSIIFAEMNNNNVSTR